MFLERLEGQEVFQFLRPDQITTISDVAEALKVAARA